MVEHQKERFFLKVRKRFGEITVRSENSALTVSAKGRKVRITKGEGVLKVPPGKAKVTCAAAFHRSSYQFVSVRRGGSVAIRCDLEPVSARLVVGDGGLPGRLLVDGKAVARVPVEIAIEPGAHEIVIEPDSQAHRPYKQSIQVENKGVVQVTPSFTEMVGGLEVDAQPAGASVFLDGRKIGETPLLRMDLPVGIFSLKVRQRGYNQYARRVVIALDEVERLRAIKLNARGVLKIDTVVPGATITVGGIAMGKTPLVLNDLASGLYAFQAVRAGMAPRLLEVEVADGKTKTIRFRRLIDLTLVNAAFYDRVRAGRYFLFGGLAAIGAGAGAQWGGGAMVRGSLATYMSANREHNTAAALGRMDAGRAQASSGRMIEGGGLALILAGAGAVSWFAAQFPWGDL